MYTALHPDKDRLISCTEYQEYALENEYCRTNHAEGARCPVCKRRMKVRAGQTRDNEHFYHNDNKFCPTKDPAKKHYDGLPPGRVDRLASQRNRSFASENINVIWWRVSKIVPYLDLEEFIALLQEAKKLNVYGYTHLKPVLLPYVYVTLINFLPKNSHKKKRVLKFCFFYEATIQSYEDLWINRGEFSMLFRSSYDNGTTKAVKEIKTSIDYLHKDPPELSPKQLAWCRSKI